MILIIIKKAHTLNIFIFLINYHAPPPTTHVMPHSFPTRRSSDLEEYKRKIRGKKKKQKPTGVSKTGVIKMRPEEHTSELRSQIIKWYAVFCLKKITN